MPEELQEKKRGELHKRVWELIRGARENIPSLAMGKADTVAPLHEGGWLPKEDVEEIVYGEGLNKELDNEDVSMLVAMLRHASSEERVKEILELFNQS